MTFAKALLFCLTGYVSSSISTATSHVVHERRGPLQPVAGTRNVDRGSVINMRIALEQSNIAQIDDFLMNVSHPSSQHYGQLWSADEVQEAFAPSQPTVDTVQHWLEMEGIVDVTIRGGWMSFETTVGEAERILHTKYFEFEDAATGFVRLGCNEYSLPEHITTHVDYIVPGVALSPPIQKRTVAKRDDRRHRSNWKRPEHPSRNPMSQHPPHGSASLPPELQSCGRNITPTCYRALYGIPSPSQIAQGYQNAPENAVGVFANRDTYRQSDLDLFFKNFAPQVPQGEHPKFDSIEDASLRPNLSYFQYSTESNLDLDILYSLTYPQTTVLYQVDSKFNGNFTYDSGLDLAVENLLDALDGSYCTSEQIAAGQDCGIYAPTRVISFSYGSSEVFFPEKLQKRQCLEFAKLGLQGTTFTVSSGDSGVSTGPGQPNYLNFTNGCIVVGDYNASSGYGHGFNTLQNGTVFNPQFPANCPYVLSVGGTQLNEDDTVRDAESAMSIPDFWSDGYNVTIDVTFGSAGGFSNYYRRPDYQTSAVQRYFANSDPGYPFYTSNLLDLSNPQSNIGANGGIYNRNGRGFPDVSANGNNLLFYDEGKLQHTQGTSLATPIWASILTLINDKRSQHGKGPVGFVNPVLYEHPEAFHDITNGSNPGCDTNGFSAVQGWDPVTGLGTPNFPRLLEVFLALP